MNLNQIVDQFFPESKILSIISFGNGHINSTYKVRFNDEPNEYILQKINTNIFVNPSDLIDNHLKLQEHLKNNISDIEIPKLLRTENRAYLFMDEEGGFWRLMNFIKDSYSIEVLESYNQAFEAGKAYGWFLNSCSNLDSSNFKEAIPDFHKLTFRLKQLNEAIEEDKAKRYSEVNEIIKFYKEREEALLQIDSLINGNQIPIRVVHNDTKINNLLFKDDKAIAVIDLDTVGPGTVLYDFGDAIRTIANTSAEDERDLTKVHFNLDAFDAFANGYLGQTNLILEKKELEILHKSPILMTYIMGIRFLTDYLNGDVYYKVKYDDHNLVRSIVQKYLIEQMEHQQVKMIELIKKYKS